MFSSGTDASATVHATAARTKVHQPADGGAFCTAATAHANATNSAATHHAADPRANCSANHPADHVTVTIAATDSGTATTASVCAAAVASISTITASTRTITTTASGPAASNLLLAASSYATAAPIQVERFGGGLLAERVAADTVCIASDNEHGCALGRRKR